MYAVKGLTRSLGKLKIWGQISRKKIYSPRSKGAATRESTHDDEGFKDPRKHKIPHKIHRTDRIAVFVAIFGGLVLGALIAKTGASFMPDDNNSDSDDLGSLVIVEEYWKPAEKYRGK